MKTKRPRYSAPNLKVDAILITFICMIAAANCAPIYDNYPVQPIVNTSK